MIDNFIQSSLNNGLVKLNTVKTLPLGFTEAVTIIKPLFIGICRADIKEVASSRDIPEDRGPLFGHEFIGQIINPGKCSFLKINDLVTFNPNVTPKRTTAYSEYFFIEDTEEVLQLAIIKMKNSFVEKPWLPEPFACIVHSVKKLLELSGQKDFAGKRVGIIGAGNSGILFGFSFKYLNGSVVLFNRKKERLDFIANKQLFKKEEFDELSNYAKYRDLFDFVIVVPTKINTEVLSTSRNIVKYGGYIHLYGGTRQGDKFIDTNIDIDHIRRNEVKEKIELNRKSFWVSGAYGCSKADFEEAITLYKENNDNFPIQNMVSKIISLQDFPQLIMDMASEKVDYPGKVIVQP